MSIETEKVPHQYWVSLGFSITENLNILQINDLENVLDRPIHDDIFKTRDLVLAQKVANVAWKIYHKHYPSRTFYESGIRIGIQPHCLKCKNDLKFSLATCPVCGSPTNRNPNGVAVVLNGVAKKITNEHEN